MRTISLIGLASAVVAVAVATRVGLGPGRAEMSWVGFNYARALAVALAVALVALVGSVLSMLRGSSGVSLACSALAAAVAVGSLRYPSVPDAGMVVVVALWIGAGAAALALLATVSVAREALGRWWLEVGVVAATALVVAWTDGGRALGAVFTGADWTPATTASRIAVAVHLATMVLVAGRWVWVARRVVGTGRDPVTWAGGLWLAGAVCERVVHLSGSAVHDFRYRGNYQSWALAVGVHVPLVCTLVLVVVAGWVVAIRPRFERLPSGAIVVPDRDPIDLVRQDLAAWLADPALALDLPDGSGGWMRTGTAAGPVGVGYDRVVTEVHREGQPIARLEHDVALAGPSPEVVTMATLAGVALDANRLLMSSLADLAAARLLAERLLRADADMRRVLGDELQDGPIGGLLRCAEGLDFGASCEEIAAQLRAITATVRTVSHGLYPPELLHGTLRSALSDRAGVPDEVLGAAVQVTAYLAAKNDPGCTFRLDPETLTLTCSSPVDDQVVLDRVAVLGGTVDDATIIIPLGPSERPHHPLSHEELQ